MQTRVALYAINTCLIGVDYAGLHYFLLRCPAIRDAFSMFGSQYLIRSELSAAELAELLAMFLPGNFVVAEVKPESVAGELPRDLLAWLRRPPSPPRGEDYRPTPQEIAALPSLETLLFHTGRGKEAQALLSAPHKGNA